MKLTQYAITFGFTSFGDLEEVKDLAEKMMDALKPEDGMVSSVRVWAIQSE
jgi:hypothetical protein